MIAVVIIMVIAVIVMIPVALMIVPTVLVVIVMRMTPVRASIRRPLPEARNPYIAIPTGRPVSVNPQKPFARRRRTPLVTQRRRSAANHNADLRKRRSS
jgi:hypothetical protein